ncbi:DUF6747 family protein [Flagellimonas onchidii]|uniref:DUF6747 family protein n=1 Tax=Flagellimonas onchidii TaxID=2562684 RepID=UPI00145617F3|nr:DUF6747 family protein [Allomuricauda onchidii]
MGTLLHFKQLYVNAFDNCKPNYLVVFLKGYTIFCGILLLMALYAFIYRAITGFDF